MRRRNREAICFLGMLTMLGLGCFGKGVDPQVKDGGAADKNSADGTGLGSGDKDGAAGSTGSVDGRGGTTNNSAPDASPGTGGASTNAGGGTAGTDSVTRTGGISGTGGTPVSGGTAALGGGGAASSGVNTVLSVGGTSTGETLPLGGGSTGGTTGVSSGTTGPDAGAGSAAGAGGSSPDAGVGGSRADAAVDAPPELRPPGATCSTHGDCAAGNCVDNVCCDKPCSGCNACLKAMTGKDDGTCAPVTSGTDPHDTCTDESTTKPCGNDGTCDGKGACRKGGAGQKCGSASCSADGNTFTPEPKCDGNGTCAAGTPQSCAPYQCAVTGCAKNCSKQADCDTGTYCNLTTSTCAAQKTNGTTATQTYECQSGLIANGVCCNTACGECNSCTTGTCTPTGGGMICGGGGKVCVSGACQAGCWIAGQYVSSGATNTSNACQTCQPATSTSGWSTKNDGTSCGTGKTCSSGVCQCTTGTDCGASGCINVNGNDNNHCGSCTNVCSTGKTCSSGVCGCAKGAPACGGCLAWDFESGSGTPAGWTIGGEPGAVSSGNGATNVQISSTRTNPNNLSSRYSLAVPVAIYENNMVPAAVAVPLCQAGTPINLAGYTLTAAVYLAGPAFEWNGGMHVNTYGPGENNYDWGIQFFNPLKNNDWNYLNYTFTQSIQVDHVSIQLDANKYWVGTMYIDDVIIAAP